MVLVECLPRVHRRELFSLRRWTGDWSVGAGFQAAQRDGPQDDAAPGLTLRRQHGPLVAFFTCRGMNLYAQTLSRVSKCYALISVEYVHCLLIYSPQGWKGAEKSIACFV